MVIFYCSLIKSQLSRSPFYRLRQEKAECNVGHSGHGTGVHFWVIADLISHKRWFYLDPNASCNGNKVDCELYGGVEHTLRKGWQSYTIWLGGALESGVVRSCVEGDVLSLITRMLMETWDCMYGRSFLLPSQISVMVTVMMIALLANVAARYADCGKLYILCGKFRWKRVQFYPLMSRRICRYRAFLIVEKM